MMVLFGIIALWLLYNIESELYQIRKILEKGDNS